MLLLPDHNYNWIEAFFRDHSHVTRFGNKTSELRKITASIIQGSGIRPAAYIIIASDLQPVTPGNAMYKYTDDSYLLLTLILWSTTIKLVFFWLLGSEWLADECYLWLTECSCAQVSCHNVFLLGCCGCVHLEILRVLYCGNCIFSAANNDSIFSATLSTSWILYAVCFTQLWNMAMFEHKLFTRQCGNTFEV